MDKHVAYVGTVESGWYGIGLADASSTGYFPKPDFGRFGTIEDAKAHAAKLNAEAGITEVEAEAVTVCSMFRPGEYDEVAEFLIKTAPFGGGDGE